MFLWCRVRHSRSRLDLQLAIKIYQCEEESTSPPWVGRHSYDLSLTCSSRASKEGHTLHGPEGAGSAYYLEASKRGRCSPPPAMSAPAMFCSIPVARSTPGCGSMDPEAMTISRPDA